MLRFATADKNVMKTAQHKEVYHTVAHLQFTENELEKEKNNCKAFSHSFTHSAIRLS